MAINKQRGPEDRITIIESKFHDSSTLHSNMQLHMN